MKKSSLLVCLLILVSVHFSIAQKNISRFTPEKLRLNYENLTRQSNLLFYEQRINRNPFIGLYEISTALPDTSVNAYVPLFQGMPVGKYSKGTQLTFSPLTKAEQKTFLKSKDFPLMRRNYKWDFWIQPNFTANFGNFLRPVESNTSVSLQTQFQIIPGLTLNTGILFPIVSQIDQRPKIIRPAATYLNYFYSSGNNYFSTSLGFFNSDQYGLNVQYRKADLSKQWSYGLEGSVTGFYFYNRSGLAYDDIDQLMLLGDVAYRLKRLDLTMKLTAGQFLWSDRGARVDIIRQFNNVEIGLYATKTGNGSTLGFNFAIPIPPGKILQGKNTRLRTTEEFRWEYTYSRGYKIGERYRIGYQLDQKLRQYHQYYLDRQFQQLR